MNNKELTRIPQSISFDYRVIERSFVGQGRMITDILIYLSNSKMTDIFGKINFSVDDFCDKMGYQKTNIMRSLTDEEREVILGKDQPFPIYEKETGEPEPFNHVINTVFECALYKALSQNLTFQRKTVDGTSFTTIQIIESLDILYDHKTKKRTKRIYSVKLGSKLLDFILTQYNLIELSDYRKIPNREGYRMFYIYLSRMIALIKYQKEANKPPYYILSVDQLADIFNCDIKDNTDKKKNITKILNKINSLLEKTKFEYKYVKYNGSRHAFHVQFQFSDETLSYFDEKSKAVFFKILLDACEELYIKANFNDIANPVERQKKYKDFITAIDENGNYINRHVFWEWFNSDENRTEKDAVYNKVFYNVFKLHPSEVKIESV